MMPKLRNRRKPRRSTAACQLVSGYLSYTEPSESSPYVQSAITELTIVWER